MNESDGGGKNPGADQPSALPEQGQQWQPPRLTVWEVARDTTVNGSAKTGSGADSHGMRDVTPTT
jgi:hypothetical protein